jgi:hypothetical protein
LEADRDTEFCEVVSDEVEPGIFFWVICNDTNGTHNADDVSYNKKLCTLFRLESFEHEASDDIANNLYR